MLKDLGHVLRRWRRRPALPALTALVLTLGAGASAAMLALGYATVLRPLPYPGEDRLVIVNSQFPGMRLTGMGLSGPEASELRELSGAFSAVGFGYVTGLAVRIGDGAAQARTAFTSAGLLAALAPTPVAGRLFTAAEDRSGGPLVALLGEEFWRTSLAAAPDLIGRTLVVDGRPHEVIGILPRRVRLVAQPVDVWVPLQYDVRAPTSNRANHAFTVIGRLRPAVSFTAAEGDIARAVDRWAAATAQFHTPSPTMHPLSLARLPDVVRGAVRPAAIVLVAAVALVLVIALANAATLLIAEADARRMEHAIRSALGAGATALLRLAGAEVLLLAMLSSVGATAIASLTGRITAALAPAAILQSDFDLPLAAVAALSTAIACAAAAIAGAAMPGRIRRARITDALAAENRGGTAAPGRQLVRRMLVGVEVALAVALVSGAALLAESFWRLTRIDPGFSPHGTVRGFVNLPSTYSRRELVDAFYSDLLADLRRQPGVEAAAVMSGLPPQRRANNSSFLPDRSTLGDVHAGLPPVQYLQFVSPDFFRVMDVPVIDGRAFTEADRAGSQPVALLNQRAAAVFFPDGSAVGRRIRSMAPQAPWLTIVGVVGDMRQGGLDQPPGTELLVPLQQAGLAAGAPLARDLNVIVRLSGGDPHAFASTLRQIVQRLDSSVALSGVETMTAIVDRSIAGPRFLAAAIAAFAGIAMCLSLSGVYGVVRHHVASRTREIGIHRALGASHARVASLAGAPVVGLLTIGLAFGTAGAIAGARALQPLLFDVPAGDPWRFVAIGAGVLMTAFAAIASPLFRALRLDPAAALRD
jgi:predicted permease